MKATRGTNRMRYLLVVTLVLIIFPVPTVSAGIPLQQVCFKDTCFQAEVVSTPEDLARGLMFHQELSSDQAMLFVFDKPDVYPFWMKNMNFSIDILWLDQDKQVVGIISDTPPCTIDPCPVYTPSHQAVYVLEVSAGMAAAADIREGSQASWE